MKTNENFQAAPITTGQTPEANASGQRLPERTASSGNGGATTPPPRLAYSVKEAALILGISEKSVRRLIDRGLLRPSRALRHLLIPRKEIERFWRRRLPRRLMSILL